jgi:hypothetical protein
MPRANRNRLVSGLQTVAVLLAGCSLQKFDYLQGGDGGNGGGGVASSAGSSDQAGTDSQGESGRGEPGGGGGGASSAGTSSKGGNSPLGGTHHAGGDDAGGADGGGAGGKPNGGTGAVGELVNPSFETSNTSGWTVSPATALTKKHAFVQWPVGGGSVPDGNYEFSTWHMTDAFAVELYQTISGLEDGVYKFKGYFSRGDGFNAVSVFARNCGATDPDPVDVPLTEPTQWLAVEVVGITVTGGSCEVGLSIDSNASNWLNADLFSFEPDVGGGT